MNKAKNDYFWVVVVAILAFNLVQDLVESHLGGPTLILSGIGFVVNVLGILLMLRYMFKKAS